MQFFRCHTIEGVSYLMADYSLVCYDSAWTAQLVPTLLVLFCFTLGLPCGVVGLLWTKRHRLSDPDVTATLGMLYSPYRQDMYLRSATRLTKPTACREPQR